jgi:hypothetical protein
MSEQLGHVTIYFRGGRTMTVTRSHAARLIEIHGANVSLEGANAFEPIEDDAPATAAPASIQMHEVVFTDSRSLDKADAVFIARDARR